MLAVFIVKDRGSKKTRNFGFVTFGNERDAEDAMMQMGGEGVRGKVGHSFITILN
jgi:RNA recognition motif-containing protein